LTAFEEMASTDEAIAYSTVPRDLRSSAGEKDEG
jgi:hypothetical protein